MQRGKKRNRQLDVWVGTPLLNLLAAFRRKRRPPAEDIHRIGVMCSPALGDTLLFSAALQDLRATYPSAEIIHFCMRQNLAAAEIIPGASRRVLIDLTQPAETIGRMRAERVDVFLDFTSWQRLTAFYTMMSGAKYIVGFETAGQRRSRGYDRVVEHRADRHEVENFRALVHGCGLRMVPPSHEPAINVPPSDTPLFSCEDDIVIFHLWASGHRSQLREWPEGRWIELAKYLAEPGTLFLITGAPSDAARTVHFVESMREAGLRAESFVSPDGFLTLTHLLGRTRLLVSVNTGVMHLGAVAGTPTISLNGPTAEHRWGARGPCVANVQPADGSGGYLHLGFEFDGQPEDIMARITVDQVGAACDELRTRCPQPVAQ